MPSLMASRKTGNHFDADVAVSNDMLNAFQARLHEYNKCLGNLH
jgi:hypothetical protein